jgi:predicted GNAT family acetyltransferase
MTAPNLLESSEQAELYLRGLDTLLASWEAYARGATGAAVHRYNVGTVEKARRRGLGTALTAAQVYDARARGCRTASLQSTEMAERVYAAVGFRDLGRILEYVPVEGER